MGIEYKQFFYHLRKTGPFSMRHRSLADCIHSPELVMTPTSIRAQMLQRAAHLVNATQAEEAWHLVGLYQQTQPRGFLHICHRILASFLELTHDYFDQGWPLVTRLVNLTPTTAGAHRSRRHRRNRIKTITNIQNGYWSHDEVDENSLMDEIDLSSVYHNHVCMSPIHHHVAYCTALFPACASDAEYTLPTPKQLTGLGKLRTTWAAKRLFKQILPSRPRTPSTTEMVYGDPIPRHQQKQQQECHADLATTSTTATKKETTKSNGQMHMGSVSARNGTRVPLTPIHVSQSSTPAMGIRRGTTPYCPSPTILVPTDSCCNTDSLICRSLIEYMLDNPALCSTEGLFRIPGNAQRIRELWLSLRGFFQTPYVRIPQPEPECGIECDVMSTRWDLYSLLDAYSPHDLATLLLRCLTTSSQCSMTPVFSSNSGSGGFPTVGSGSMARGAVTDSGTNWGGENTRASFPFTNPDETGLYSSVGGLIHPEAAELCFLATKLQYGLEHVLETDLNEDWMQMLCQARQLLTYRIVLQLLLPNPERMILFDLLRLFKQISQNHSNSRMSAECLARCTALAVFGAPTHMKSNMTVTNVPDQPLNHHHQPQQHQQRRTQQHPWSPDSPLRWRIDTLTNLINMADDLNHLPDIVYSAVRDRLRIRLGHSPISRVPFPNVAEGIRLVPGWRGTYSSNSSLRGHPTHVRSMDMESETSIDANSTVTPSKSQLEVTQPTSLGQRASTRASLHRAKSSLDPVTRQRANRGLGQSEPFKLWRRQKTGHLTSTTTSNSGRVLMKARSVLLFSPQKSLSITNNRTAS